MKKLYFFNEEDFLHWNENQGNLVTAIYDNAGEYLCDVLHKDYLHLLDLGFLESDSVIHPLTDEQRKYFIETYGVDITIKQKEDEKGSEKRYTRKEMENAILIAADIYENIYEDSECWTDAVERICDYAVEFEKKLKWQDNDERDYLDELEKYEEEIRISIEPIKDFSTKDFEPDLVRCNNCMTKMYVDYDTDICPCCGKEGCLMDIES